MIKPGVYDFTLYRGSTDPFAFRLKDEDGEFLPFDEVRLTIAKSNASAPDPVILRKSTEDLGDYAPLMTYDEYAGIVMWTPTPAESRLIPVGAKAKYELELRLGSAQLIYLIGTITGAGGINDDN